MANLRVDKITSTETFETTGSVQFGNDNALKIAANSGFDLTSNDFTMESWIYMDSVESFQTILMYTVDGTEDDTSFQFDITSTQLRFVAYVSNSSEVYGSNFSFGSGTWYHVAATRTNDLVRLFVDGDLIGTHNFASTIDTEGSAELNIGYRNNNGTMDREVFGHLTNIRIINGKALYTANFKPPMRELEVTPETTLLCCQSKTDASHEKTGKTITVLGNAVASELTPGILTPVPKAGAGGAITGSVEFDGTGDCLTAPDGSDFEFGSDNFTIEAYIYYTGSPGTSGDTYVITSKWDNQSAPNDKGLILRISDDGSGDNLQWFYTTDGSTNDVTTGSTILSPENWYHIAFVRNGTVGTFYINGISDATTVSFGSDSIRDTGNPFRIGANLESGAIDQEFQGFISNLRVIKGTALYTDDFIPPTRELKKIPGTVLLCCQDPDSPLTEATGKTITGFGDLNQSYGAELVTNGQFTADSDWTKGTQWTISGGSASITDSPDRGSDSLLTQDVSSWIQEGQMYRVGVDWSFSSGDFDIRLGGDSTYTEFSIESSQSSPYFFNIEAGGTNDNLAIIANQHAVGDINSISVEKLPPSRTGSNFTPQVGDDRKVTFEGVTKINTENYFYLPTGDTASRETTGTYNAGTRGIFGGGFIGPGASDHRDTIQYINIASTGNAIDAGDLTVSRYGNAALASATRAVWAGGIVPTPAIYNTIDAVEIMSTGNAFDFGDLYNTVYYPGGFSNRTRGIYSGGAQPILQNDIGYITISSKGNSSDFGDLITARNAHATFSSPTRGIIAGGWISPVRTNIMEYVTIASTGNGQDFGDLTRAQNYAGGCGSAIRGLCGGGNAGNPSSVSNIIDYVTISAMGNAQDFGDLTSARTEIGSCSSATRGVFAGSWSPSKTNIIDYVTIQTTANAKDFGDLVNIGVMQEQGTSNGHGGLG